MVMTAVKVSILAMGVIFIVLGSLIAVIELMIKLIPYSPPAVAPASASRAAAPDAEGEQVAAIHAAIAAHRGQSPDAIHITDVRSLS